MASVTDLATRHAEGLEKLEEAHLDWTLDVSMDDEADPADKPAILSPFLPSRAATIEALLALFPNLGPDDCLLDIGSGDGRVLVAACQRTGCQGVGVDISPACVAAAEKMVASEDAASGEPLASRLTWVCADCTKDAGLLERLGREHAVTVAYLYVFPQLLSVLKPQLESLTRAPSPSASCASREDPSSSCKKITVVTAGYHLESSEWPWGWKASPCPRDPDMGPGPALELRHLNPAETSVGGE